MSWQYYKWNLLCDYTFFYLLRIYSLRLVHTRDVTTREGTRRVWGSQEEINNNNNEDCVTCEL